MAANSRTAHLPEILASSVESRELPLTSHVDDLTELSKKVVFYAKPFEKDATLIKNTTLVLAHLQRLHDSLSDSLNEDLITLLSKSIPISSAMLEVAITHEWVMTAVNVLDFRRRLVQALGVGASSLLQVPHLTPDIVKGLSKVKSVTVKELHELIAHRAVVLDQTQKLKSLTDEQTLDVRAVTQHISDMSLIASICVEDETDMVVGDTATCNFTLTRQNLREGEAMGAVHAPFFPGVKFEEWVAFLIDKRTGNLHGLAASKSPERVIEEKIKFRLVRPGEFLYQLLVVCDSHTGLDKVMDLQFKVFSQKERPREIVVHEEDEALDNEPSLMSLMMNGQNGEEAVDSSDEEEEASPEANLPEVSDGEEEVDEDDEESE